MEKIKGGIAAVRLAAFLAVASTCWSAGLELTLSRASGDETLYEIGSPLTLEVAWRNRTQEAIVLDLPLDLFGAVDLDAVSGSCEATLYAPSAGPRDRRVRLLPGKVFRERFVVNDIPLVRLVFPKPGRYRLVARFDNEEPVSKGCWVGAVESPPLIVEVRIPPALDDWIEDLRDCVQSRGCVDNEVVNRFVFAADSRATPLLELLLSDRRRRNDFAFLEDALLNSGGCEGAAFIARMAMEPGVPELTRESWLSIADRAENVADCASTW